MQQSIVARTMRAAAMVRGIHSASLRSLPRPSTRLSASSLSMSSSQASVSVSAPFSSHSNPLVNTINPNTGLKYGEVYKRYFDRSVTDHQGFWLEKAADIEWTKKGTKALTYTGDKPWNYRWFADGWETNACYNMIDKHIKDGRGDRTAIIYDSPVTGVQQKFTYKELKEQVAKVAGALQHAGVKKGDRVLLYMPMIPQTIVGMLATVRIGAVHAVVFGGFPAPELAKRIMDAQPTVILTASCGIESPTKILPYKKALDEAIKLAKHEPKKVLVWQRPQLEAKEMTAGRDENWTDYVAKHGKEADPVSTAATDPLYILYTSGTTGMPKGVVRDVGSIVPVKATMQMIYRHNRDEVYWSGSDLGWAVGHSYIVYGPLLQGSTSVLYEGKPVGTPDAGAFWRVIAEHKVKILFTAPTALRAIRKEDAEGKYLKKYNLDHFEAIFLGGERADPASLSWARNLLNEHAPPGSPRKEVFDHYWQTETGWVVVGNPRGVEALPVKDGSATKPAPGWDVRVVDDEGNEVPPDTQGNLVVKLPLPPSGVHALWNNEERFRKSYMERFPGFYETGDAGRIDADGYTFVMSRTDDVMNVAGHRLGSGQMEEVLQDHPSVAESAVVAVPDALKGHIPVGLVVLKSSSSGVKVDPVQLEKEIVAAVRQRVGAVACFRKVIVVPRLPKTRSGKVLRNVLRAIAEGKPQIPIPPTIEDASVIAEVKSIMHENGIGNVDADKEMYQE